MPVYEYKCKTCSLQFDELIQSNAQEAQLVCPHCGNGKLEKLFSVFGMSSSGSFSSSVPAGAGCAGCSSKNCNSCH